MQKTYFLIDKSNQLRDEINTLQRPSHLSYGAYHLENESLIIWDDITLKKCLTLTPNSQVVINDPKWAWLLKKLGHRVILINVNSNHVLERSKTGLKHTIIKQIYDSCDIIMCLDKIQVPPLKELNTTAKLAVNPLMVDTELTELAKSRIANELTTFSPFYLSSGFDAGTSFDFGEISSNIPIVCVTKSNPLPYNKYTYLLCKCKAVILKRIVNPASSDLTGNTTIIEALAAKKPVLVNAQKWIPALKEPNIYIYKDDRDLERILLQNELIWKETSNDYSFSRYLKKLKFILQLK